LDASHVVDVRCGHRRVGAGRRGLA
jgi:hypothetical protein